MSKRITAVFIAVCILFSLCGCESTAQTDVSADPSAIDGLGDAEKIENAYAECFTIYEYESGETLITMTDGSMYLAADSTPDGLDGRITVIPRRAENIYMAATAVMCFYDAMEKISDIRFSALEADGWYIENAAAAMERGDMVYAGKYRDPDYELLLTEKCDLSVQSTMLDHVPKVKEKLEELGIPVFIDRSSYETHPLGRCEWVRVYAHLAGCPELGDELFEQQKKHFDELEQAQFTGKSAVFFYITASGKIVTRKAGDYLNKMIEIAGGKNVFDFVGEDNASSSVTLEPEQFCLHAKDADIIIYNSSIAGELGSIAELTAKNELLADFRAVQNGNVWCTNKSVYQEIMSTGEILTDLHTIFSGSGGETKHIYKLQ